MSIIWGGGGSDNLASTGANWVGGVAPVNGDAVLFVGLTSNKACNWDLNGVTVASITFDTNYTATFTGSNGTYGLGDWVPVAETVFVWGNGSTWNISGHIDPNTAATPHQCSNAGAIINLSGVGKTWGIVSSNSITPTPGVVNLLLGASYDQKTGEIGGIDFHNYGTYTTSNELNINRSGGPATRIYNHSTGVFGGVGSIIDSFAAQWVQQDGIVSTLGTIAQSSISIGNPDSRFPNGMLLVPATYQGSVTVYIARNDGTQYIKWGAQPSDQSLPRTAGTYDFTGTGGFVTYNDVPSGGGTLTWDNTAGCTFNIHHSVFNLSDSTPLDFYIATGGGKLVFKNTVTVTLPSGIIVDTVENAAGGSITLASDLSSIGLIVSGGTFSAGTKNITTRDDWVHTGGNYTAAGFAGSTITVGGCIALDGSGGTLNLNPDSGWTLVINGSNPLYTFRVSHANIKNLTVTGGILVCTNCTDQGGNSGVTFS